VPVLLCRLSLLLCFFTLIACNGGASVVSGSTNAPSSSNPVNFAPGTSSDNRNPGNTSISSSAEPTPGSLQDPSPTPNPSSPKPLVDPLELGEYSLRLDAVRFELVEANENGVTVPIHISRRGGHQRPVTISVTPGTLEDTQRLETKLEQSTLAGDEIYTSWRAELGVSIAPLLFHERTFTVTADDGRLWMCAQLRHPTFIYSLGKAIWREPANLTHVIHQWAVLTS